MVSAPPASTYETHHRRRRREAEHTTNHTANNADDEEEAADEERWIWYTPTLQQQATNQSLIALDVNALQVGGYEHNEKGEVKSALDDRINVTGTSFLLSGLGHFTEYTISVSIGWKLR